MYKKFKQLNDDELEVLSYLYENQNAMDTLDGILHWWLLDRTIQKERRNLEVVVNKLLSYGFLIEKTNKYSKNAVYSLNKEYVDSLDQIFKGKN